MKLELGDTHSDVYEHDADGSTLWDADRVLYAQGTRGAQPFGRDRA